VGVTQATLIAIIFYTLSQHGGDSLALPRRIALSRSLRKRSAMASYEVVSKKMYTVLLVLWNLNSVNSAACFLPTATQYIKDICCNVLSSSIDNNFIRKNFYTKCCSRMLMYVRAHWIVLYVCVCIAFSVIVCRLLIWAAFLNLQ